MRTINVTGLKINRPPLYFFPCLLAVIAVLASVFISAVSPSTEVVAITPPDSCFAFNAGAITDYYNNEGNNGANPACPKDVDIPATIGGVPVTSIASYAFYVTNITSVSIPGSVTTIGDYAFSFNYTLASAIIPEGVTSIGSGAFYGNRLASIIIPASVSTIYDYAFAYNKLTDVSILGSPTEISNHTFYGNQLTKITLPDSITTLQPNFIFGQNTWGYDAFIDNGNFPAYNIWSDDPLVVQHVYDNIWYARVFTTNPANPQMLADFAISERHDVYDDGNNNGILSDSTGGHIINPASTVIRYQDSNGTTVAPSVTVTGLKTGKSPSSALESSDYLHSYHVTESAIPAPINPYSPTPEELSAMEAGFDQYYRMGEEITFSPEMISGYTTPNAQTVTLSQQDNVVTFIYTIPAEVTSVPFGDTTPPSGITIPLLTQSVLSISSGDCTTIQSASLISPNSITATNLPSGINLVGGLEFELVCTSGGSSAMSYVLGGTVPDISKLRVYKYNTSTHVLVDMTSSISISNQTVDGNLKTVISYSVLDGGELDEDGTVNGIIDDPLVIGYQGDISGETLADTGTSLWILLSFTIGSILLGSMLFISKSKNS